jgi:type II secretory pathway pseudopilin PulG
MVEVWVVVALLGVATSIIAPLVNRITTQNEIIRTQKQTIDTQDRTITALEIAGKLQDKLLQALPQAGGPSR